MRGGVGVVGFGVVGSPVTRLFGDSVATIILSLNDLPSTSSKQLTSKRLVLMVSMELRRLQSSIMLSWSKSGSLSLIMVLSGVKALVLICCQKEKKKKTGVIFAHALVRVRQLSYTYVRCCQLNFMPSIDYRWQLLARATYLFEIVFIQAQHAQCTHIAKDLIRQLCPATVGATEFL